MRIIVYSILNILIDQRGTSEAYEIMRELKDYILEDVDEVIKEIEDNIRSHASMNYICPECGNELINKTYKEGSEYIGSNTYEDINEYYCPICGYEE